MVYVYIWGVHKWGYPQNGWFIVYTGMYDFGDNSPISGNLQLTISQTQFGIEAWTNCWVHQLWIPGCVWKWVYHIDLCPCFVKRTILNSTGNEQKFLLETKLWNVTKKIQCLKRPRKVPSEVWRPIFHQTWSTLRSVQTLFVCTFLIFTTTVKQLGKPY